MSFQWLQMRITEEKERRERERIIIERMPRALKELRETLTLCVTTYNEAFGADAAQLLEDQDAIHINAGEGKIQIVIDPTLPGFRVNHGAGQLLVEVGMLPGDRIFYKDQAEDKYLTAEEVTRRILDKTLFPKLE